MTAISPSTKRSNGGVPPVPPKHDCQRRLRQTEIHAARRALQCGQATFHDVATVWFALCDSSLSDDDREPLTDLFTELQQAFADVRGGVVTSYYCRQLRVAAVLTSSDTAADNPEGVVTAHNTAVKSNGPQEQSTPRLYERAKSLVHAVASGRVVAAPPAASSAIHIEPALGDPQDWEAKKILFRCQELHNRALEFLTPKPRKICMRMVFGVIASLLGSLDSRAHRTRAHSRLDAKEVRGLHAELDRAAEYLERSMQRQAQLEYFVGMMWSWLTVLVGFGGIVGSLAVAGTIAIAGEPLILATLAGGLGAVVSVMQRMTSGRLKITAEDGKRTIRILGGIRPVLGAILGVVLYVLLGGGLLPLENDPPGAGELHYYVVGLAFIAGFSERFAQDMITGAAGGLNARGTDPPAPDARRPPIA
jgi:hypothetical protein